MNNWEIKQFFDERMASLPPSDEDEYLDGRHIFLKYALQSDYDCSDPVVGNFEIENRNIKYDGYYTNEDEKEFHVISLIYFDDPALATKEELQRRFEEADTGFYEFIKEGFRKKSSIPTDMEVGEHVQEMIDCICNGYKIMVDVYSNVRLQKELFPTSIAFPNHKDKVQVEYFDGNDIVERIKADEIDSLIINFKEEFGKTIDVIKVADTDSFDVYMFAISGLLLSKIYHKHKNRLMDGNIRAYLKRTQPTNRKIAYTIDNNPEQFVALNNGLSAVASYDHSDIKKITGNLYSILSLDRLQIVNGGQTTVTIYDSYMSGKPLDELLVPVKLTVLKRNTDEGELVSLIAVSANTQTAISKSDLSSNKPFYKSLESYCLKTPCYKYSGIGNKSDAYYWFFERANGLYNTRKRIIWNYSKSFLKKYPESKKFSKKILAKAVMSCSQSPNIVCLGNEKCFTEFDKIIENNMVLPDTKYYKKVIAALIIWKQIDKIIAKDKLPIKAAVLPYTIAYLFYKTDGKINMDDIFETQSIPFQMESIAESVAKTISQYFISVQDIHPNTLMWGRKEECWLEIKNLPYSGAYSIELLNVCTEKLNFFPENPAIQFISNPKNLNDAALWLNLLSWNEKSHYFTAKEVGRIKNAITSINVFLKMNNAQEIKMVEDLFVKAAREGFEYQ